MQRLPRAPIKPPTTLPTAPSISPGLTFITGEYIKGQRHEIGYFRHGSLLLLSERLRILKNAGDDLLCGVASFPRHFGCYSWQAVVIG